MKMLEGLKNIYSGENAASRHTTLFSICGIAGILDVYVTTVLGLNTLLFWQKLLYISFWIIFAMFLTGYEVIFLRERELPDIDLRSFKLLLNKPMMIVLAAIIFMALIKFFPGFLSIGFLLELILAVPLTLIQAGFSFNYNSDEAFILYKKLSIKNYLALTFKRLGLVLASYLTVSIIIFTTFFIAGIVIAISQHGDTQAAGLIISSLQFTVTKLSDFMAGVLLTYSLVICTLVWDYELIKNYEKNLE